MLLRAAIVVLVGLAPLLAFAAAPPPPPGCSARQVIATNLADKTTVDNALVTSTVAVDAGVGRVIWDVDVRTYLTHPSTGHLDLSLTSPAGKTVQLSTDNGGTLDDGFDGTRFDDSAVLPISDADFPNDGGLPHAVPEGSLGSFKGENPNGTWTLNLLDDTAGTSGTLTSWSLELVTLPASAPMQSTTVSDETPVSIPDRDQVAVPLAVSVPGDFLTGLSVTTKLLHTYSGDLDVTLTSPSGTTIVLTTDNGVGQDNVFNGTVWKDNAATPVTDATFVNLEVQPELQPEGALSRFLGENPNGTWLLTIADDGTNDLGTLEGWSLTLETATGAACVSGGLTVTSVSPAQGPTGGGTRVSVTGTNFVTGASVRFGGVAGSAPEIASSTASATTPARSAGRVEVSVRNPDGEYASKMDGFNFLPTAPAPVLVSLTPNAGSTQGGTPLSLHALNVIPGAVLRLGDAAATQLGVVDESTVVATSAASTYGTFDVILTNPDGQSATLPGGFTYEAPAPKLTDLDPNIGLTTGETQVTVRGDNFLEGVEVTFGGAKAEVQRLDAQTLQLTAPAHAAGTVDLVLKNPDGQSLTRTRAFTYEVPAESREEIDAGAGCGCGAGSASVPFALLLLSSLGLGLRRRVRL